VREQIYANHGITIGEAEAEAESSADEREGHDHVASQPLEQP
jgi:hypothetical protein